MSRASFKRLNPLLLTNGAISQWFRLSTATNAGSGLAFTVQDILNPGQALTQSTDARKPTAGSGSKGLSTLQFTDDVLLLPISNTLNNNATRFGLAFWIDISAVDATARRIFTYGSSMGAVAGAEGSPNRLTVLYDNSSARGLYCNVYSGINFRRALTGPVIPTTGKHFLYFGIDCSNSTEATQCIIAIDGAFKTLTFNNAGNLVSFPTALNQPSGTAGFCALDTSGNNPTIGTIYSNIFILNRQITQQELLDLMNFENPI